MPSVEQQKQRVLDAWNAYIDAWHVLLNMDPRTTDLEVQRHTLARATGPAFSAPPEARKTR